MFYRLAPRSITRNVLAAGTVAYASYHLARPLHLEGSTFDKVKESVSESAGSVKDKLKSVSPLKPESPGGIPGGRTAHNPSTSMNHGQTAGESDAQQADPLVSAQKKRQKGSDNATNNDEGKQTAKLGGGTGAKISSGHEKNADGQRVPNHDGIKSSNQPKKESKSSSSSSSSGLAAGAAAGMQEKEGEAKKEEAFNEETGEINWDCPCLGGMAHGPCGEDFKSAFSCFVYSKEEPKGSECLGAFKKMQECFKEHEDVYGNLVNDDETPEGKVVA